MAIKPLVLPRPWAVNATYATGPFVGFANKADPGVGIAAEGHRPGAANPTAAEHENWQQNLITGSWVPWVNSGTSLGAASASIIERDILGKFAVTGFDVLGLIDATAIQLSAPNTFSALVTATSTGGGTIFQTSQTGNSTSFNIVMAGAAAGTGYSVMATTTSTGACIATSVPALSSSRGLLMTHSAIATRAIEIIGNGVTGIEAMSIVTTRGVSLRLTDTGPLGCPLIMTPRGSGPSAAGSLYVHTSGELRHVDNSAVERLNWNSVSGMSVASQANAFTAGPTLFSAGTVVQSMNYTFVSGARYWIDMSADIGRGVGSTRTGATISCLVGGVGLSYSGATQAYTGGLSDTVPEKLFRRRVMFTAGASGLLAVTFSVTPTGGAGNLMYVHSSINIEGHYD